MEKYEQRFTNTVLVWTIGLVLGVLFGLIVLGWWLWPVQWVDASPEQMLYQYQVEYLNTVIEAFGYTGNTSTAQARYFSLGANGETALAEIVQNPGSLPPDLVVQFSQQVAGVPAETLVTQPIVTPSTTTGLSPWIAVLAALAFIFIGAVVTYLVVRGRDRQETEEGGIAYEAPAEEQAYEETGETEPILTQADFEEQPVEEMEIPEATRTTEVEEWYPLSTDADEELPTREDDDLDLPPFLAAAGAAAVSGAVAAELADEEPVEAEAGQDVFDEIQEGDTFIDEEQPIAEPSPQGAAMAGMAAAWLAEEEAEAEPEEPVLEDAMEEVLPEEELVVEEVASKVEIEEPDFDEFEAEVETTAPEFLDLEQGDEPVTETAGVIEEETAEAEAEAPAEELVKPHDPIEVKMRKKLEYVEGIGPAYAQKLGEIGILTTGKLMVEGVTRAGRQELAEKTGISETLILKWLNMIDLYRIKGIGSEYAELLKAAGVDTVPELAQRNADNLFQALANTNETKRLVRQLPTPDQVVEWVEQAKNLPRIIQY